MQKENLIMKNIEILGDKYVSRYLAVWKEEELINDWWEALKFFFSHSFMRGRRDELSNEYYCFAVQTLQEYLFVKENDPETAYRELAQRKEYLTSKVIREFKNQRKMGKGNSLKHSDFKQEIAETNPLIKKLITPNEVEVKTEEKTYRKKLSLGNDEDLMMVLEVLNFVISDPDHKNIYGYIKRSIEKNELSALWAKLDELRSIGDKIVSFLIRDVLLMNPKITFKDYEKAFPVDTWVKKIAHKLDCNEEGIPEIKKCLIKKCDDHHINPVQFAAGLWYLGFNSLDVLLENCLGEMEIKI
jgi:hypothetical protein